MSLLFLWYKSLVKAYPAGSEGFRKKLAKVPIKSPCFCTGILFYSFILQYQKGGALSACKIHKKEVYFNYGNKRKNKNNRPSKARN